MNASNKRRFYQILTTLLILGYNVNNTEAKNSDFENFIHKLKSLTLPFVISSCNEGSLSTDKDRELKDEFLAIRNDSNYICDRVVGLLSDTTHFFAIIWLPGFECSPPMISIFNKSGKLMSDSHLYNDKNSGGDCDFYYSGQTTIDKKYNIQMIDTITERNCDTEPIKVTKYYITKITGSINENGNINISKPRQIDIKKRSVKNREI